MAHFKMPEREYVKEGLARGEQTGRKRQSPNGIRKSLGGKDSSSMASEPKSDEKGYHTEQ